mmetsp:Transcript_1750/g.3837  ORF Transcript_1750/g.3837 Transcript_1750/m.3837 type:complete len:435 (-) Transcript_1750:80-1384(-)|eukprot:scaffold15108_cov180-Amphora_coffeaeformis.AAC.66
MAEDDAIKKEFLNFLEKDAGDKGVAKDGEDTEKASRSSGGGSKNRRSQMSKSLSKEDLKVEPVNDFFADFEEAEFAVDWDAPDNEGGGDEKPAERKARLARSRRLGPGDRRKEINRRNSSRRLMLDGGTNHTNGGNSSGDDDGFNTNKSGRGLNRRASNRSLVSTESGGSGKELLTETANNSRKDLMSRRASNRSLMSTESGGSGKELFMEKSHSKKNLFANKPSTSSGDFFPDFEEAGPTSNKMTVKSLRDDVADSKKDFEMSFGELPKDWQVSTNPAAASFLPATQQRAPARTKSNSNNPRHRRNSLNSAPRPQLSRRSSSRGGAALMNPDGPGNAVPATTGDRRTPRRHSLMGDYHGGEGMHRQRSTRGLGDSTQEGGGSRRTTTIPRRGSAGANGTEMGSHRPSNNNTTSSSAKLTGESIAAMGGATIRW